MNRTEILDLLLRTPIKETDDKSILLRNLFEQLKRAVNRSNRHVKYLTDVELLAQLIVNIEKNTKNII
jgi:uncharacterized FlaG/YvyC family protein